MVNKLVVPFCGHPIYKITTNDVLSKDELAFLKSISEQSTYSDRKLKLLEGSNILNNKELHRIKNVIWNHFDDYVRNVLEIKNKFYMCNSWGTIQNKGNYLPKNTHPNAIFSSVFYVNAPSSSISFIVGRTKIQEGFHFDYEIESYNEFNSSHWELPVSDGDIIFFPGQLPHESKVHELSSERIVIGSSYFAKGTYGKPEDYDDIDL
jgi:hypothetical protein